MRNQWRIFAACLVLALVGAADADSNEEHIIPPAATIQHPPQTLPWTKAPAILPKAARMAVLEGDPKSEGLFTLRLKIPAGTRLPPHWHPRDERVTILSGRIGVGFGDDFDESLLQYFDPGGYYVNPAHSHHFVLFAKASEVQITGFGPWEVHTLQAGKKP